VSITTESDLERYVDASAAAIGLTIAAVYRRDVIGNFRQLASSADLVMSFPLSDAIDTATVFRA
jgi:phytoene/squalene synthetase